MSGATPLSPFHLIHTFFPKMNTRGSKGLKVLFSRLQMLSEVELKLEARSPYSEAPISTFSFCMNRTCSFPASPSVCKAISGGAVFPCLLEYDARGHVGSILLAIMRRVDQRRRLRLGAWGKPGQGPGWARTRLDHSRPGGGH